MSTDVILQGGRENSMDEKSKRTYQKPKVRQVKLSLAELTLGTNCDTTNDSVVTGNCTGATPTCNV
jgi:hypothetical protein